MAHGIPFPLFLRSPRNPDQGWRRTNERGDFIICLLLQCGGNDCWEEIGEIGEGTPLRQKWQCHLIEMKKRKKREKIHIKKSPHHILGKWVQMIDQVTRSLKSCSGLTSCNQTGSYTMHVCVLILTLAFANSLSSLTFAPIPSSVLFISNVYTFASCLKSFVDWGEGKCRQRKKVNYGVSIVLDSSM